MVFNPTIAIVHNEGCDLHYWHQGQGPLLLFVPGGNGHGRQFNAIMAGLMSKFTCATFDRRQMSASQVKVNKRLSPPQQARDIRAIIKALGFHKAIIFGSSSGGIFGFQFAHDFPEMVDHLISHEAGITCFLPDATETYEQLFHLNRVFETEGLEAAAAQFATLLVGYDAEGIPKTVPPEPENVRNFWENEMPSLLGYTPNLLRIKENKTSVGVMRGALCKDAFYARAIEEQAKVLGFITDHNDEYYELRRLVRAPIFKKLRERAREGHIVLMTACLAENNERDTTFLEEHLDMARGTDVPICWVNAHCDQKALGQRLSSPGRYHEAKGKLTDVCVLRNLLREHSLIEPSKIANGPTKLVVKTMDVTGPIELSVGHLMSMIGFPQGVVSA
ncbi:uncharacterized protein J7T54_006371 [Emericellopsis cladophorae]|uniref:AB hydrolase-1 domain-containing protein n=1 Tax=Emericellopsis cladophorae TaxID=2686198 RepID=A0A9Q0BGT6_9HYPO|nr:uncharacterized protein J7T54_006371 [Emericellopsis cladophorae]KAI6784326.1 hypothetical protein J7T54_006371 [Emericellopsis cladophorae]